MRPVWLTLLVVAMASLVRAQAPLVEPGGVVNDANYSTLGVAPGSIIGIFGVNLASKVAIGDTIPLSATLDIITSVTFDGVPAGLYSATIGPPTATGDIPAQVNVQLPFESLASDATSATVHVVVTTATGVSVAQPVTVLPAVPGIFSVNERGTGQAIATDNDDNAIAAAVGSIAGLTTHPISISSGHALIIWCTGLGAVTPPIADGANSFNPDGTITLRNTVLQPTVTIGGVPVQTVYSSVLSPQFVSEYQIGVGLAPNTPIGNAEPVVVTINGVSSTNNGNDVTIAVAP